MLQYLKLFLAYKFITGLSVKMYKEYNPFSADWEQQQKKMRKLDLAAYHLRPHLDAAERQLSWHQKVALDAIESETFLDLDPADAEVLVKLAFGKAEAKGKVSGALKDKGGTFSPKLVFSREQRQQVTAVVGPRCDRVQRPENIVPPPGSVSVREKYVNTSPSGWYSQYTIYG